MPKLPVFIGFDPIAKAFFDADGSLQATKETEPDISITQKKLNNLKLSVRQADDTFLDYTDIPSDATFEGIIENDYDNPEFADFNDTNWVLITGAEYQYTTALSAKPQHVYEDSSLMTEGTAGALAAGEWAWSTGDLKVTVRLTDDASPTTKADGYVQYVATYTVAFTVVAGDEFNLPGTWYDTVTSSFRNPDPTVGELTFEVNAARTNFKTRLGSEAQVLNTKFQLDILEAGTAESMDLILFGYVCNNKYLANPLSSEDDPINVYTIAESLAEFVSQALSTRYTEQTTALATDTLFTRTLAGVSKWFSLSTISTYFSGIFMNLVTSPTLNNILTTDGTGQAIDSGKAFSTDGTMAGNSDNNIPTEKATKTYADGLVVGLLDDRGNYDASVNTFPATGGSGSGGAILKGDIWYISVAGTLGGDDVNIGDSVRALIDTPGQTTGNWSILEANIGYVPENVDNKATDLLTSNNTLYPSTLAVNTVFDLKQDNFGGVSRHTPVNADIDGTTRILTVTAVSGATFDIYIGNGETKLYTISSPAVFPAITDTSGIWNFYYDINGNSTATQSAVDDFSDLAMIYRFLWNATLPNAEKPVRQAIEWHTDVVSSENHNWMHAQGTIHKTGFDLAATPTSGVPNVSGVNTCVGMTTGTNSDDALEYTITNSAGAGEWEQDLGETVAANITTANGALMEISYLDAGGLGYVLPATRFPFAWDSGTNVAQYIDTSGVRQPVPEDEYFIYYAWSFQDKRNGKGVILVSDPTTYATLPEAQAGTWDDITSVYPLYGDEEVRPLYKYIFLFNAVVPSAFPVETKYTSLIETEDIRKQRVIQTTATGSVLASAVSVSGTPTNYTPTTATSQGHFEGIDTALGIDERELIWEVLDVNKTAIAGHGYYIDGSSQVVTLTLPASPLVTDKLIGIYIIDSTFQSIINGGGNNFDGVAGDLTTELYESTILGYSDATTGYATLAKNGGGDMLLASVQAVTGLKTFDTTKLAVKGSSTGTTAIASANAGASNYTLTLPTITDTLISKTSTDVLSNKTFTLPQINDTSSDHQYIFAVSELAADRTVTLPLLLGNDEFVFKDFIQVLTNKTLTSPVINVTSDATGDIYYRSAGGLFTRLGVGSNTDVLTLAAGIPSWAASTGGGMTWATVATATNAVKDNGYVMNVTASAFSLTLPAAPDDGDAIGFKSVNSTTFAATLNGNGKNIDGSATIVLNDDDGGVLVYSSGTGEWELIELASGTPGGGGTTDFDSDQNILFNRIFN